MKFGEVAVAEAEGAVLAHSLKLVTIALKKARVLSRADLDLIAAAGLARIVVARLEPGDVAENEAAQRVAGDEIEAAAPFTGRANLHAEAHGLLVFDRERLDRLNLVDEAVTLGTLLPFAVVTPRQIVATVKIIPFAAPRAAVERCIEAAGAGEPLLRIAPFRNLAAGLVQTRLPGLKESILDKTREVTQARLSTLRCRLAGEERCAHMAEELAAAIGNALGPRELGGIDLLLIHGASAILDRRDVIPAAIAAAGGRIEHFGMPVDPGNLLLLGRIGEKIVLGLPGCARSPKENGFDWVLQRVVAGLPVGPGEIMRMGSGGLLAEIPSRPLPRARAKPAAEPIPDARSVGPRIGALLLAAGQSRRMGGPNKLLAEIPGSGPATSVPMVVRVARRLLASHARPIVAVLGARADEIDATLGRLPVERVRNPDFADGLSTSLKRGIAALPEGLDGVLVCLGDMPLVAGRHLDRLIAAFNPIEGLEIVVPTRHGKRGNPVLWSARFFPEMMALAGDVGAKHLIGEHAELVAEIEMDDDAILVDIDTPEALARLQQKIRPGAAAAEG